MNYNGVVCGKLQRHCLRGVIMQRKKERQSRVTLSVPFFFRDFELTLTAGRKFAIFYLARPLTKKVKREECRRNAGKRFQLSSIEFEKKIT